MGRSSAATPGFARTFLAYVGIGAVVLAAVASIAGFVSVRVVHDQARGQPVAAGQIVAIRWVAPLVTQGLYAGHAAALRALDDRVRNRKIGSTIQRVKVWSEDGVILYSDDPRLIGQRYPLDPDGRRALTSQGVESRVADLSRSDNVLDRSFGESLEVYVGTRDTIGRPILVETHFTTDQLDAVGATLARRTVALVLVSLLALGLLLVPLGYSLARRMSRLNGTGTTADTG